MKIRWEKPPTPETMTTRGWIGDRHIATIVRTRNHTARIKRVYAVEVLGITLPNLFAGIGDARAAAESEYARGESDPSAE